MNYNYIDEEWRDIEGYKGLYKVSNYGRVKSLNYRHTNTEKLLKPKKNIYGYLFVGLYKDGKMKYFQIHRLVATAFIPNPNNLPQVNHKDENKENNCVDNLEWCDRTYNINYGTRNERMSEKMTNRQDLSKQVYQYSLQGELIKIWNSTAECGRNGFIQGCIVNCCNGDRKTHKSFIWSYEKRE